MNQTIRMAAAMTVALAGHAYAQGDGAIVPHDDYSDRPSKRSMRRERMALLRDERQVAKEKSSSLKSMLKSKGRK